MKLSRTANLLLNKLAAVRVRKKRAPAAEDEEEVLDNITSVGDTVFPKALPWQFANVGLGAGTAALGAGAYGVGKLVDTLPKDLPNIDNLAASLDARKRFHQWFDDSLTQTAKPWLEGVGGKDLTSTVMKKLREDATTVFDQARSQSADSVASKTIESIYNPLVDTYNATMTRGKELSPALRYGGAAAGAAGGAYGLYHLYRMLNPPAKRRKSLYEIGMEDTR